MDMGEYLDVFIDESREHIQTISDSVLVLENDPNNKDKINEIFRAAHSLKGISGSMGFKRLQRLTHDMEDVFSEIREDKLNVTPGLVDVLFKCLDAIEEYIDSIVNTQTENEDDHEELINELYYIKTGKYFEPEIKKESVLNIEEFEWEAIDEAIQDGMNSFMIHVNIDESCLLKSVRAFMIFKAIEGKTEIIKINPSVQDIEDEKFDFDFTMVVVSEDDADTLKKLILGIAEIKSCDISDINNYRNVKNEEIKEEIISTAEMNSAKETNNEPKEENQSSYTQKTVKKPVVNHSVRVDIDKLDNLMNLVSELIISKNAIISQGNNAFTSMNTQDIRNYKQGLDYLERITSSIHESVMRIRMVPVETVFSRFPRMIRDISKKLGKNIQLIISGEDTELDRTVIDEIGDPLMHMLRNSCDHGIEMPEERKAAGKNIEGTVKISAESKGDNVIITVTDDGRGINVDAIRKKAIENGIITEEEGTFMAEHDIIMLMFKPSFSTADKVSEISGRGVGLDVVKSKIEGLGGDVTIETELGKGTSFIIRLPLTLAIIKALMVHIDEDIYAIPLGMVRIVEAVKASEISYIQNKPFVNIRNELIPLYFLREYFGNKKREYSEDEDIMVAIINRGKKSCGIVVDDYINQQEVVVKQIGSYMKLPKVINGATILGNGDVALIIDLNTFF